MDRLLGHLTPEQRAEVERELEGKELTPEQRDQLAAGLGRLRSSVKGVTAAGVGAWLLRRSFRRVVRVPRLRGRRRRRLMPLAVGLVIALLSVTTCSAGVDLASMTAEFGDPVPATRSQAEAFIRKAGSAVNVASETRTLRIDVTETEATSALSLGMLVPELMALMDSVPPEELRTLESIEEMRDVLRRRREARAENRSWQERLVAVFDPELRTGDVQVRFTSQGEIVLAGYVQAWRFRQPALVVVAPAARSGELQLDFVRGKLGRLGAPEWAFDTLGGLLSSLILMGQDYAEISEIRVGDGRMSFEARMTSSE